MPEDFIDSIWDHYDHGTQRAILKLYRSAPPDVLARAGERLGEISAPALVVWGGDDPYLPPRFAHAYGEALGGESRGGRGRGPLAVDRQAGAHRAGVRLPEVDRWRRRAGARRRGGGGALPDPRPAHGRPRRAPLSRRPVRARGLHDLERQLVRRPPHAGVQRAVPAARALPDAAGRRRDRRGRGRRAVRAARPVAVRRAGEVGRALVRLRGRRHAVHRAAAVPVRRRRRARRAARAAAAAASRSRPCWPSPARWRARSPASSSRSPRSPTRWSRARAAARCSRGSPSPRPCSCRRRSPRAASSRSRSGRSPRSRSSARCSSCSCRASTERCGSARCCTRLAATAAYLIDTPMGNNAVRLAELFGGALVVCFLPWRHELRLRPGLVVALLVALAAWPLYPTVRDVIKNVNDESTKASYYDAAARLPRAGGARARPDRDPVHARALRGLRGRTPVADRARMAAPARHRAQQALLRRRPQRPHLRHLAERERRPLRRAPGRAARLLRAQGGGADRARAELPAPALGVGALEGLRGDCSRTRS